MARALIVASIPWVLGVSHSDDGTVFELARGCRSVHKQGSMLGISRVHPPSFKFSAPFLFAQTPNFSPLAKLYSVYLGSLAQAKMDGLYMYCAHQLYEVQV